MRIWIAQLRAHEPPVLMPEGFAFGAFLLGPIWLAAHRAWVPACVALAAAIVVALLTDGATLAVLELGLACLTGLLGRDLVRWHFHLRGYRLALVLAANDRDQALVRPVDRAAAACRHVPSAGTGLMRVAVVDYRSGNLASASRALAVAAGRAGLEAEVVVTADPDRVARADRIVLPGQGAFADCADGLAGVSGMREAIETATEAGVPFLGICVGMQLMAERGLEHATTQGFGWIKGEIVAMDPPGLRLPQMGWNELHFEPDLHALLAGLAPGDHAYFVHGYALSGGDPRDVLATTDYGGPVVAMVATGSRAGTQFHVEKSQGVGIRILMNFLRWIP